MKRLARLGILCVGVALLAGCATSVKNTPGMGVQGFEMRLEREDYEILSSVEGTGQVTVVMGVPSTLFSKRIAWCSSSSSGWRGVIGTEGYSLKSGQMANAAALFDALAQVPDADGVIPFSSIVETSGFPLFYKVHVSRVRGKAVKIKTDEDLME